MRLLATMVALASVSCPCCETVAGSRLAAFVSQSSRVAAGWAGTYQHTEDAGRNAGGAAIIIDRTITIARKQTGLTATIESEGYQIDETLVCDVIVEGNRLKLLFRGYPDGSTVNQLGVKVYKKGELLLTLERVSGRKRILTYWGAITLENKRARSGKVYFRKTGRSNS